MLIEKPMKDPMAVGLAFRELLNFTIRDLCHAALDIIDRNNQMSCAQALHTAHVALSNAHGESIPRRHEETDIGNESLVATIRLICYEAEKFAAEYDELDEDATTTPYDMERWLLTRGKKALYGLTFLLGHLLCAGNLHRINFPRLDVSTC